MLRYFTYTDRLIVLKPKSKNLDKQAILAAILLEVLQTSLVRDSCVKAITKFKNVEDMKNLVNNVQLIGFLGMDPEVKSFDNGSKMLRVSIATDASYKSKSGERVKDIHWHTLVGWGKTAELGQQMLKKGKKIAVEGMLVNRSYEDNSGKTRYTTEIRMDQFLMLEKKK